MTILIVVFWIAVLIVAVVFAATLVRVQTSKMLGRLQDYAAVKKMDLSAGGTIFILLIGLVCLYFPNSAIIGIGIFCALAAYYFIRFKGDFWKIIIVKIIAIPVILIDFLVGIVSGYQSGSTHTREYKRYDGRRVIERTHFTVGFPAHIDTGSWSLDFVYELGYSRVYENYDGMRCLVDHKRKMLKGNEGYDYDIVPLYSIHTQLPGWIRWLY